MIVDKIVVVSIYSIQLLLSENACRALLRELLYMDLLSMLLLTVYDSFEQHVSNDMIDCEYRRLIYFYITVERQ